MTRLLVLGIVVVLPACSSPPADPAPTVPEVDLPPGELVADPATWGELEFFDIAPTGTVVGMDRFNARVHVFEVGSEPRSFGRRGEGPGEIQRGGAILAHGPRILMSDGARVAIWSWAGEELGEVGLPMPVQLRSWHEDTVAATHRDMSRTSLKGVAISLIDVSRGEVSSAPVSRSALHADGDTLCHGCAMVRTGDRLVAVTNDPEGRLLSVSLDGGQTPGTVEVPFPREPWPLQRWEREIRQGRAAVAYGLGGGPLASLMDLDAPVRPPSQPMRVVPHGQSLGVDEDRNVWVLVNRTPPGTTLAVYSDSMDLIATVRAPTVTLEAIAVSGRWLAGLSYDELDRPLLWRWHLPRVPGAAAAPPEADVRPRPPTASAPAPG